MRSPFVNRLLWLVLVPVYALLVGFTPGQWHCADGRFCEVARVNACCCGCTEENGHLAHICGESSVSASVGAADCGCYRQPVRAEFLAGRGPLLDDLALAPAGLRRWTPASAAGAVCYPIPPAAHSPPRYLTTPADPRGPPNA